MDVAWYDYLQEDHESKRYDDETAAADRFEEGVRVAVEEIHQDGKLWRETFSEDEEPARLELAFVRFFDNPYDGALELHKAMTKSAQRYAQRLTEMAA